MKPLFVLLVMVLFVLVGCTQNSQNSNLAGADNNTWRPPYDQNDFSDALPFDPNDVCPYECCLDSDERYYGKNCVQSGTKCVDHVCIKKEVPAPEQPAQGILADNEVYPGVFISILSSLRRFSMTGMCCGRI